MGKKIIYVILVILLLLLTFFGLGPVLFADGSNTERMYTLLIVIVLYLLLLAAFYLVNRFIKK
jgi:protein-S-isoprenylcysteine O-methyltransferase Ste14